MFIFVLRPFSQLSSLFVNINYYGVNSRAMVILSFVDIDIEHIVK